MRNSTLKKLVRFSLNALIFIFSFHDFYAQSDTEFWFVAPSVTAGHAGNTPIEIMVVSENEPANVTISQPANPAFVPINIPLGANDAVVTDLTDFVATIENQPANTILNYGILIEATNNITAYYAPQMQNNPDIFALKGAQALGTEFVIPMQTTFNNGNYTPVARSGFDIVATEDNTTITITPSSDITGHTAGTPFTIILNKGETYSAVATGGNAADRLNGSTITSDKPIAVTIKDDSVAQAGCRDLIGDQIVPVSVIGDEYIIVKGYLNIDDKVYITAAYNNTEIFIDGVSVTTINAGQTYDFDVGTPTAYINTSEPVYVLHVTGFGCELGAALLPSIECTGSEQVSVTRATNEFFAINLMVAPGGEDNFLVNGNPGVINAADFAVVPGSDGTWMFAQIDFSGIAAVGTPLFVTNTEKRFHMAVVNGGASSGCRYGYFSDFARYEFEAIISDDWICETDEFLLSVDTVVLGAEFEWTGPNGFFEIGNSVTVDNSVPDQSGWYYLNAVIDNCPTDLDSVEIEIRPLPEAPEPTSNAPVCEGQTLQFEANGTSGVMNWSGPNGFSSTETNPSISPATPANNGTYIVYATLDECDGPEGEIETVIIPPIFNETIEVTICSYDTYELPDESITSTPGFYTFDFLTVDGCDSTINVELSLNPELNETISAFEYPSGHNISCNGLSDGSILLEITGGSPNYTYAWTGPDGFTSTDQNPTGLAAGTYNVTVTDELDCVISTSITLTEPTPLEEDISAFEYPSGDNISCHGESDGSINLEISEGSPTYSYAWTGPNGFTSTDEDLSGLEAGTYEVTATDINGCTISTSITLVEPDPIQLNVEVISDYNGQNISCFGASDAEVFVQITGGSPDYTVNIDGNETIISGTTTIDNLSAGAFTVYLTDANGCESISAIVITEPSPVNSEIIIQSDYNNLPVSCATSNDGIISTNVNGGTAPYSYAWNNDPTLNSSYLENLGIGTYTVEVTDANNCTSTSTVTLDGHPNPTIETSSPQRICEGEEAEFAIYTNDDISHCMWTFETGEVFTSCNDFSYNFNTTGCIDATVQVTSVNGCVSELNLSDFVCIDPSPNADFYTDNTEVSTFDNTVKFWNESTNSTHYSWDFGDGNTTNVVHPSHSFPGDQSGDYVVTLYAFSQFDCMDSTSTVIRVKDDIRIFVPNAFTPDGDQFNETFTPVLDGDYNPYDYTFLIFNRWGEVVFESRNADIGWDGTFGGNVVQDGVYIWKISVTSIDGSITKNLSGHVALIK